MTKRFWYNEKLYVSSVVFSKHALERMRQRCVNEERILELIRKGIKLFNNI